MPVYQVIERTATPSTDPEVSDVVNIRIIIAATPSQAKNYASKNRFEATPLTSMELAQKVGQGYKVETATPVPPAEPAAPPAGAAAA